MTGLKDDHHWWWVLKRAATFWNLRHWVVDRCAGCGHRFRFLDTRHSFGNAGEVFHGPCIALRMIRDVAKDRLVVLDLVTDVWGISSNDAEELMRGRDSDTTVAWRVFHDLDRYRRASEVQAS